MLAQVLQGLLTCGRPTSEVLHRSCPHLQRMDLARGHAGQWLWTGAHTTQSLAFRRPRLDSAAGGRAVDGGDEAADTAMVALQRARVAESELEAARQELVHARADAQVTNEPRSAASCTA